MNCFIPLFSLDLDLSLFGPSGDPFLPLVAYVITALRFILYYVLEITSQLIWVSFIPLFLYRAWLRQNMVSDIFPL